MYWGASRECRYSDVRKGIGSITGYWRSPRGIGVLGTVKRHQMGVRGCIGGLAGSVGTLRPEKV